MILTKITSIFAALCLAFFLTGCPVTNTNPVKNHVVMSMGKRINSLDPALAADTMSQYAVGAFYDTLLQYRYEKGKYVLEPAMLAEMPNLSKDGLHVTCKLRDDLYFQEGAPFHGKDRTARKITSRDVKYSILRLADPRIHSTGYWVIRGSLRGLDSFREAARNAKPEDYSPYDMPIPGFELVNEREFVLHLTRPNPRILYFFALPYLAIVSRAAVEYYGQDHFALHPCGSGPFELAEWKQDYVLEMKRYADFRREEFQGQRLPQADRITCYLVKQPLASWLMFLQGELDYYALEGDNYEAVIDRSHQLIPVLKKRGISLQQSPQLETNYIGFCFTDPMLAGNPDLRKAVTLAFDRQLRIVHSGGRFTPAYGPVPPGVSGAAEKPDPDFGTLNIEKAKEYLAKAGYPNGIDSKTGERLSLSFDQAGSDTNCRQIAELLAGDLKKIGIELKPEFNTRPRFFQKLAAGEMQLFRMSWTGDYPDAENFLQLFYGPNTGSCNRVSYRNPDYDREFQEILTMQDSPAREQKCRGLVQMLQRECPWIWETHTMAFVLTHSWLKNYIPHDFGFNRWKYLSSDSAARENTRRNFTPLSMSSFRENGK